MPDFDHFRFLTEKSKNKEKNMDTVIALDFFNQEAKVGDTIVYATRRSSDMDMHKAKILDIIEYQTPYSNYAIKVAKDMKYEPGWAVKETVMLTNPLFVVVKTSLE